MVRFRCRVMALAADERRASRRLRVRAPGRWLVELRGSGKRVRRVLRVRPRRGRLRVLATGDSMIQIVDGFLGQRLGGRARVRSDAHISTGLSKPSLLDWVAHARQQVARVKPDVTVMFIGANDGFAMPTPRGGRADCCGRAWVREYARRARSMMRTYARGGAGRVFWLTLPAPRGGDFRRVFGPVNAALRRAGRGLRFVRVLRIDRLFTPGFRFRDDMVYKGRTVDVRQDDGVHLSVDGASIAASVVVRALRRKRVL